MFEYKQFSKAQKKRCWNKADDFPGRDPKRWKIDPNGNPVLNALEECQGALCYEYEHIVPFSKGGKTVSSNCRITSIYLPKNSKRIQLESQDLDIIEYALYGDYKAMKMDREYIIREQQPENFYYYTFIS